MSKEHKDSRTLSPEVMYTIGEFNFLLNENTGELRILVHENGKSMRIVPKSDNSIILISQKA